MESCIIAQEMDEIPELLHLLNGYIDPITGYDTLTINYVELIPFLIKSNQELHERIVELENKI